MLILFALYLIVGIALTIPVDHAERKVGRPMPGRVVLTSILGWPYFLFVFLVTWKD